MSVLFIEIFYAGTRQRQQWVIFRLMLRGSISKIRQQGKCQLRVGIGEMVEFQFLQEMVELVGIFQQGRDDHHGAVPRRDSLRKIHARQAFWFDAVGYIPVHESDGAFQGQSESQHAGDDELGKRSRLKTLRR